MAENSNEAQTQSVQLAEIISIETRRPINVIDMQEWLAARRKLQHTSGFDDAA